MTKSNFKSFDQYVKEAEIAPFELPIDKEKTIIVDAPTGHRLIKFQNAWREGDLEASLWALTGDAWNELEPLIGGAPHKVMKDLTTDMAVHFDLTDEYTLSGPSGGTITEKDPRKIKALQNKGYKIVGEA